MNTARPDCSRCLHYYVTWDAANPRGCRAFAFKSEQLPAAVVLRESGRECHLFEDKSPGPRKPPRGGSRDPDGLYG